VLTALLLLLLLLLPVAVEEDVSEDGLGLQRERRLENRQTLHQHETSKKMGISFTVKCTRNI